MEFVKVMLVMDIDVVVLINIVVIDFDVQGLILLLFASLV
jgi:hypothetical protein